MRERCHRCHTILTSEDKHWYSVACETCETDLKWEEYEQHNPIKSAYWRWRAICFGVRWLRCATAAGLGICMRLLLRRLDARRQLQNARRER